MANTTKTVADRYTLLTPLGRGGMGVVWEADDTLLKRKVAIKEVRLPDVMSVDEREAMQKRALREARAAARLTHPCAVTVFDVHKDEGRAFIVMELVDAPTLADLVKRNGPVDPQETARIGLAVLSALESAHAEGIVHRDVKPGNVMVSPDGRVKLADFGIASLKDDPKITATGLVLGSPSFMAPEQAEGRPSGPEADLWALGATMYFAVDGRPPFDKGQPIPTLHAVMYEDPPRSERAGPLGPVITELLSKDPAARPRAARLQAALEKIAEARVSDIGPSTAAPVPVEEREPEPTVTPAPARTTVPTPPPSRRAVTVLATLGALALLAALVFLILTRDQEPAQEAAPERSGSQAESPNAPSPQEEEEEATPAPATGGVPASWTEYEDPSAGWTISYPPDWGQVPDSTGDGDSIDFRDDDSNTYLRVDWTESPGPDAVAAWEAQSESFGNSHDGYQELQVAPTTFKGSDNAAVWEYVWSEGGANLHGIDLGFVTPDGEYGFALNFVTAEDDWDEAQPLFRRLKRSFEPPQ